MGLHLGARYLYAEERREKIAHPAPITPSPAPTAVELSILPPEILERLRAAAVELNRKAILNVATELEEEWKNIASFLRERAASYDFAVIERLLGPVNDGGSP
jgi:hypothetical protein